MELPKRGRRTRRARASGVKGVTNSIFVRPTIPPQDIKDRIAKALHRNAELEASFIHVEVNGSTVTLSGRVQNWRERRIAEKAAWAAPGVTEVRDHITLP
jgi:osmotically-inducible protein OsmY